MLPAAEVDHTKICSAHERWREGMGWVREADQGRQALELCATFGGARLDSRCCWVSALTSFNLCQSLVELFADFVVFRERELLHEIITEKRAGIYVGIDPTAPSMHVGHMLPFMVLAWGYVWGLPVTFLVSFVV